MFQGLLFVLSGCQSLDNLVFHPGLDLVVGEEEAEIVQPAPLAVVKQAVQKTLSGRYSVVLKRDDQAEHRQIAENQIPDDGGQGQEKKLDVIQGKFFLFTGFYAGGQISVLPQR